MLSIDLKKVKRNDFPVYAASPAHLEADLSGAFRTAAGVSAAAVQSAPRTVSDPAESADPITIADLRFVEDVQSEASSAWRSLGASKELHKNDHDNVDELLDLRSAMTPQSHSAFADRVSSSAEQRTFDGPVTMPANKWTSADELNTSRFLRPFLLAIIALLSLICVSLWNSRVPERPQYIVPALRTQDAATLSKFEPIFLIDQSESMKLAFDCPLGQEGIITSRTDWAQRQLEKFARQIATPVNKLSTIRFADKFSTNKSIRSVRAGIALAINQALAEGQTGAKPPAFIILTDFAPGNLSKVEQQMLQQSMESANKVSPNSRFVFLMVGNDLSRLKWNESETSWLEGLPFHYNIKQIPFSKLGKANITHTIASSLR